jgi:hypothetical protein
VRVGGSSDIEVAESPYPDLISIAITNCSCRFLSFGSSIIKHTNEYTSIAIKKIKNNITNIVFIFPIFKGIYT